MIGRPPTPLRVRFYKQVHIPTEQSACWVWKGAVMRRPSSPNYGSIKSNGKTLLAHRASFELHKHAIPDGMMVCHTCDNPLCVNPGHLVLGTHAENMRDRDTKRRLAHGERHGNAILTDSVVAEMRALFESGIRQVELARRFGTSQTNVSDVVRYRRWRHVRPKTGKGK